MKIIRTAIDEVVVIEPDVFHDGRGYFFESFSQREFSEKIPGAVFVQDNESFSWYGVIRGLHYQLPPYAQAKLVRVASGRIMDVAVDMREGSPTFAKYAAVELTHENHRQMFVPRGFAHGFVVLSDTAVVQYKCDNFYNQGSEAGVAWNDAQLGIDWMIPEADAVLSEKDKVLPSLADARLFHSGIDLYGI